MQVKDQLYRTIALGETPKRIVSLVPSQTELLSDLGLDNSIVGITKFCVHPKHLKQQKSIVGGTKQIDFEKVSALKPDVILCNKEENTMEMIKELEKIAPVHISDIYTIEDGLELIHMYGNIFSKETVADEIIKTIREKLSEFKLFIEGRKKLNATYFIWKDPWMVAANNTFINSLLSINNFVNEFKHLERYPEISLDDLKQTDIILLSSEPYPFKVNHVFELQKLVPDAKVLLVDGEYFSWYGSRLQKAFDYFKVLHVKHFS